MFNFMKIRYGKALGVVLLTLLIWVWADLALEESFVITNATVTLAESKPGLWVTFQDGSSTSIEQIELIGSRANISELRRALTDGKVKREFFLEPEQMGLMKSGEYTVDTLDFMKESDVFEPFGLTVESVDPEQIQIKVVELVKKPLTVVVLDQNRLQLKTQSVEPSRVEMFVPAGWAGPDLRAMVQLSEDEISQARKSAIEKVPQITLGSEVREGPKVNILLSTEESRLEEHNVRASLDIAMNPNMQGRYKVVVENLTELLSKPISISASRSARDAFEAQQIPAMTLHVSEKDTPADGEIKREVVYNFPEQFVNVSEIRLKERPRLANFRLEEIKVAE